MLSERGHKSYLTIFRIHRTKTLVGNWHKMQIFQFQVSTRTIPQILCPQLVNRNLIYTATTLTRICLCNLQIMLQIVSTQEIYRMQDTEIACIFIRFPHTNYMYLTKTTMKMFRVCILTHHHISQLLQVLLALRELPKQKLRANSTQSQHPSTERTRL